MVAYAIASLTAGSVAGSALAGSDVRASGVERHGRLERADRPRVARAERRERLAQELAHHGQAVLGDGDAGGRDAGAQLLHRQVGALWLVGHDVLLWGPHDLWGSHNSSGGAFASAAERGHRPLIVRQVVVLLRGLDLGPAPLDLGPQREHVAQALDVQARVGGETVSRIDRGLV